MEQKRQNDGTVKPSDAGTDFKKKDNDTSLPEAADRVIVRKKKSCHPGQVHDCGGQPLFRFLRNRRLPLLNCKERISPYTVVNIQADYGFLAIIFFFIS